MIGKTENEKDDLLNDDYISKKRERKYTPGAVFTNVLRILQESYLA